MSSILDVPSIRERIARISVGEYHRQPERNEHGRRTELICGLVIEKTGKSPRHEATVKRLFRILWNVAGKTHVVSKDSPLTLRDSEPEPDIAVVAGHDDDFTAEHPHTAALVIEVAVTSTAEDRALAALYAEAGVAEYWIVLPAEQSIEVHRHPENGRYRETRIFTGGNTLDCASVPGVRVVLGELFAGL